MSRQIEGSTVVVTGGTGSFGRAVAIELLKDGVRELRIFSRDEAKQEAMRLKFADERIKFYLGDVRDRRSVVDVMRGGDFVFHAAALKQVPSCEFFPMQAVQTNVLGSENVLAEATDAGVKVVVCLSTDKAVYPINAMGMTKALMEKTAQAYARTRADSETVVAVTRYGNVMCSRNSVIPLLAKQVMSGRSMTITDPAMTRFMMSLEESVSLVKFAFENAVSGDLFVRKAPACTIGDLAAAVAIALGRQGAPSNEIGTRGGEKLFETLLSREERRRAQDAGDYFRIPLHASDLEYEVYVEAGNAVPETIVDYTSHNTDRLGVGAMVEVLENLREFGALGSVQS
jgi:UDP-N-acetylglucosamine 4,6-dehydratase